jgi:hypothetical protein
MINNKPPRTNSLWLVTVVGLAAVLLLLSLSALSHQPTVYAQQTPREILVNAQCSPEHEHIRFGQESSHYYWFWAKRGLRYQISTNIFDTNQDGLTVDTKLLLYRHNPLEHGDQPILAENDDIIPTPTPITGNSSDPRPQDLYQSLLEYVVPEDGYYWVEVQNMRPGGEGSYCLKITLIEHQVSRTDICEPNDTIQQACEILLKGIVVGEEGNGNNPYQPANTPPSNGIVFNFAPMFGFGPDQDFYKLWVRENETYTCKTHNLSQGNDTLITLYNHHGIELGWDDNSGPDLRSSEITQNITYDGWLYIRVSPVVEVNYQYAHHYTYQLECDKLELASTAPVDHKIPASEANNTAGQALHLKTPNPSTVPSPHDDEIVVAEATPAAPAVGPVAFVALSQPAATATPDLPSRSLSFTIQVYYDRNDNQSKDPDEGIANLPIYIYADSSDKPLQTTTSQGGAVMVGLETSSPSVQLVIPYLGVSQEIPVGAVEDIQLRIAP